MQENKEAGSQELATETEQLSVNPGETAGDETKVEQKPKKLGGYQRKVLKLEAEIQSLREQVKPKTETVQAVEVKEPKEDDFSSPTEYYKALADFKADVKVKALKQELEAKETKKLDESKVAEIQQAYNVKAKKYAEENPTFQEDLDKDFEEHGEGLKFSKPVHDFLLESDVSPALVHEFVKDREVLEKLNGMSFAQASRELVKLEEKLSKPKEQQTTKAPKPPNTLSGRNATGKDSKDPYEPGISFAEYDRRMAALEQKAQKRA